jgi:hypothetical protein
MESGNLYTARSNAFKRGGGDYIENKLLFAYFVQKIIIKLPLNFVFTVYGQYWFEAWMSNEAAETNQGNEILFVVCLTSLVPVFTCYPFVRR